MGNVQYATAQLMLAKSIDESTKPHRKWIWILGFHRTAGGIRSRIDRNVRSDDPWRIAGFAGKHAGHRAKIQWTVSVPLGSDHRFSQAPLRALAPGRAAGFQSVLAKLRYRPAAQFRQPEWHHDGDQRICGDFRVLAERMDLGDYPAPAALSFSVPRAGTENANMLPWKIIVNKIPAKMNGANGNVWYTLI